MPLGKLSHVDETLRVQRVKPPPRIIVGNMPLVLQRNKGSGKIPHIMPDGGPAELFLKVFAERLNIKRFANRPHPPVIEAAIQQAVTGGPLLARAHEAFGPALQNLMEQSVIGSRNSPAEPGVGRGRLGFGGQEQTGDRKQSGRIRHLRASPSRPGSAM